MYRKMIRKPLYTAEFCRERLDMWLRCEEALSTSQSYRIGTRYLSRADLPEVREQIEWWENKYDQAVLEEDTGMKSKRRTFRAVPRDL